MFSRQRAPKDSTLELSSAKMPTFFDFLRHAISRITQKDERNNCFTCNGTPKGKIIKESLVILTYFDETMPVPGWLQDSTK
jgi:hypothetical protein